MLKIKPYFKYLFIGIVILIPIVLFFTFFVPVIPAFQGINGRVVLLQKTDFQELLEAGRKLISKAEWEEYVTSKDGERSIRLIIPKDVKLPKYIRKLKLRLFGLSGNIKIFDDHCLKISFGNRSSGNFGVLIYPKDFNEPHKYFYYGDKELLPGLWYFDDGYDEFGSVYKGKIENMVRKNKYLGNK